MVKWAILGHARHGKDTVAEMLLEMDPDLRFCSSSEFVMDAVVWPVLSKKYNYKTKEECFEDRVNHRSEWYDLITAYNTPDKSRLANSLLRTYDIYVGLRNREELLACKEKGLFDVILWVDASRRVPPEPESSCTILPTDCMHLIDNNGSLKETKKQVEMYYRLYKQ